MREVCRLSGFSSGDGFRFNPSSSTMQKLQGSAGFHPVLWDRNESISYITHRTIYMFFYSPPEAIVKGLHVVLSEATSKSTTLYHLRQRTNLWCKLELAAANPTSEKLHLLLLHSSCIPSKSKSGTSSLQQLPSKSKPRIAFLKIGF